MEKVLVALYLLLAIVSAGELTESLYIPIRSSYMCFRRFNATNQFGCSSVSGGSYGALIKASNSQQLKMILEENYSVKIVIIMPDTMLTAENIALMRGAHSDVIAGVVATWNKSESYPSHLSFDSSCPNNRASMYGIDNTEKACDSKQPWNPPGSAILFNSFPYPLFLVTNSSEIEIIYNCLKTYSTSNWPKCAAKLESFMQGAGSTEICLRRNYMGITSVLKDLTGSGDLSTCGIIHGSNVLMSFGSPVSGNDRIEKTVLLIVTRSDALSVVTQQTPSTSYVASTFTSLSAATFILKQYSSALSVNSSSEIVVAALDGEALDYIGSSSFADALLENGLMIGGRLLNSSHIKAVIELGELGLMTSPQVFFHLAPNSSYSGEIVKLTSDSLQKSGVAVEKSAYETLPPGSLHVFSRKHGDFDNIEKFMVVDYSDSSFKSKYFHSHRDTIDTIQEKSFLEAAAALSTGLALSWCEFIRQGVDEQSLDCSSILTALTSDELSRFVKDAFGCFAGNCSKVLEDESNSLSELFPSSSSRDQSSAFLNGFNSREVPSVFDYYTLSVQALQWPPGSNTSRTSIGIFGSILHALVGSTIASNVSTYQDCKEQAKPVLGSNAYLVGSDRNCVYGSSWLQQAISPLFSEPQTVPSLEVMLKSPESTWTESFWSFQAGQLELFVMADPAEEAALLAIGCVFFVVSLCAALFVVRLQRLALASSLAGSRSQVALS